MGAEDDCKPRSIRGKTPVRYAPRNSCNLATCTVLQIERDKNVSVSYELAENAQLRRRPRTLIIVDSVFPQNQPGRPSGQGLGHQSCRERGIAWRRLNKIKYLQSIRAQTRETHAAPFNEDLGSCLFDILSEKFPGTTPIGSEKDCFAVSSPGRG